MSEPATGESLRNRIDLRSIPFTERGSRILLFCEDGRFAIKLAERWSAWEQEFGHYRRRPPIVRDWALLDEAGNPLAIELTTAPEGVEAQTASGLFRWLFVDEETLYLQLPPRSCGVRFELSAARGQTDRRGGEFQGDPAHRDTHRNVAYTTNAKILENSIAASGSGAQVVTLRVEAGPDSGVVLNITPRLAFQRAVPAYATIAERAARRWREWFAAAPAVAPEHASQYAWAWWCMRAGLLSPRFFLTRENMAPSKTYYVGVWQWDAFFHALAYRHTDKKLAQDHLRIVLDHQRADGMLPDAVHDEGVVFEFPLPQTGVSGPVTKPPLIAWAALKIHEQFPDLDFLAEVYEPIARWNEWWFEQNDDDRDGIVQYNHPYCASDNCPLWDEGMPVESPDLNSYLVMQMDALARIAELIGEQADAPRWRARAAELTERMIAQMWDEKAGLFWALRDDEPVRIVTLFNLHPLLTGRLPSHIVGRLLEHLTSPREFWTRYPLPVVAADDPKFDPEDYWRGPTWVNLNYLYVDGLAKCGQPGLARELAARTLELVQRHPDIFEYYNPVTGNRPPKAAGMFGWTSAVFIDLAIRHARGQVG